MVNYHQLANARPALWSSAAEDWAALGTELMGAGDDLAAEARGPIAVGWSSPAGQAASRRLHIMWFTLQAGSLVTAAVADVLTGLADSVSLAQKTLEEARSLARRSAVHIDDDGSVTHALPPWRPGASEQRSPFGVEPDPLLQQVSSLLNEALREATQADQQAQSALQRLAADSRKIDATFAAQAKNMTDWLNGFKDTDANDASRTELDMITESIPKGPPALVSQWWAGLPIEEQERLKLAAPGVLGTLNGIPPNVQAELRGSGGLDRVKLVNYALQNWHNPAIDWHGKHQDNCTNFVSHALQAAGLHEKGHESGYLWNRRDDQHTWYHGDVKSSHSWGDPADLHEFLTSNHGQEVTDLSQAKPGDIIFWQRSSDPSTIHHAAVITAVLHGHVYYTQHSGFAQDADLNLRQPTYQRTDDPYPPIIVRPNQD